MKKNSFILILLFALTMVLLFASAIQQQAKLWTFKPLNGVYEPTPKPELTLETYRTAQYQSQMEPYLKENFGFREPLIRFYNQYLYDFFRASNNKDIIVGKDHWLYFIQHVNEYYGTEMYRWHDSKEEAREAYDREARLMWKLHGVLKDYDVDFLLFMAPQKGFVYPEHLPKRKIDTTSISAREYFSAKFDAYGFPYIEMTKWFIDLKKADTLPYTLFPQTGAHWDFSAALATDSLLRFMGDLKGIRLPRLEYGPFSESTLPKTLEGDYDIEILANLIRPLPHNYDRLYDAQVTAVCDSATTKPTVIFVGTSFLMRMYYFVPFDAVFSNSEYWYYNSTAYYDYQNMNYAKMGKVADYDLLEKLLETDYVVWFAEGDQMCKASFGFVEAALTKLCLSDDQVNERCEQLIDSLGSDPSTLNQFDGLKGEKLKGELWLKANRIIMNDPEKYFPEIAGNCIPTARNPRIHEALAIRDIKRDSAWMFNLRCQTVIHNTSLQNVMKMEAQNVLNGRPLLRDETEAASQDNYVESLVRDMVELIRYIPEMMEQIREKADANGTPFEQQLHDDAAWIINNKIQNGEIQIP